ncbi:class I adenylate-forming enzyme family protein [Bosea sp. (in: a-proteobacteria)]|uniref:class I adenylate-forming enzyme family protein n=1 Tax=Bosea sp. (in: a-proteobacteria) TaxID=1871050 RepID=UPI00262AE98C|nr:AMP-binding protein [Bosea sp. (in: a-proteobacteria)]MCO5089558.1 AMP-binding protein [Bosea sp. (in: a-proteobacteria)]
MNAGNYVTRSARFHGERTAIVDGDRALSYRMLDQRTNRLGNALVAMGVMRGDRVLIVLPNSAEWIEADLAIVKAGGVSVPITAHLHEREITEMAAFVEPRVLITSHALLARLGAMIARLNLRIIVVGGGGDADYETLIAGSADTPLCVDVDDAVDGRIIRFTSGTTGAPKGVYLTHRNWLSTACCMLLDRYDFKPDDVYVGTSPYVHAGGLWLLPALMRGATIRVLDRFDPDTVLGLVDCDRCTVLQVVPTGLRRLLDHGQAAVMARESLRVVSYGGAPIDSVTLGEASALMGSKLIQGYGLNESPIVSTLREPCRPADPEEGKGWYQPLGREVTMAEVRILDADGEELGEGEVGEIAVRGPMVFRHYWRNPEATENAVRQGFLRTGDLGLRGENGFLFMAGRSKDIIVTGGYNVAPPEVEEVLLAHDSVKECVVVGMPDREWGEKVTAFVVLKAGRAADEQDLIDFCRERLTSYKKPKNVHFVAALPVNSNGKVVRRMLREQAMAGTLG